MDCAERGKRIVDVLDHMAHQDEVERIVRVVPVGQASMPYNWLIGGIPAGGKIRRLYLAVEDIDLTPAPRSKARRLTASSSAFIERAQRVLPGRPSAQDL